MRSRSLLLSFVCLLLAVGCSETEATPGDSTPATTQAAESQPQAAEAPSPDTSDVEAAATIEPAAPAETGTEVAETGSSTPPGGDLLAESTCDELVGQTIAAVGPLELLSADSQDGILVCRYLEPENAFQSIRVTFHADADPLFLEFVTDPGPQAEVIEGYGDAAVLEPEERFSAVFEPALLLSLEATRLTDEPGVTELDRDATLALADLVLPIIEGSQ